VMLGTKPKVVERLMLSNRPYGWWPFGDVSAAMMGHAIERYVGAREKHDGLAAIGPLIGKARYDRSTYKVPVV
jgi:hypothetical protein